MTTFVSKEIQAGLDAARLASLKKASRLRLDVDGETYPILRLWHDGFTIEAGVAPHLRGLVDIFDGANHMYQCLIVASEEEAGEIRCDFKRSTQVQDKPPLDFARDANAPIALLTQN